jgi:hypothetical protein
MVFGLFKRRRKADDARQREIDAMYDVNKDVPTTFSSDMGGINWDRQPGTHSYNFKANSPLIAQNTQNQLALGNQNTDLIEQSRLATSANPEQSRYYNAFKQQFDNEYERLRGQQATRMSSRQNNALGNIANNQVQQQLASYKGTLPYQFNSTVLQPMIGTTSGLQNSLQQNSNSVLGGLLSGFNTGQSTYENEIARRIGTQRYEQDRLNQRINARTSLRDIATAFAGPLFRPLIAEKYLPSTGYRPSDPTRGEQAGGAIDSAITAMAGAGAGGAGADPTGGGDLSGLFGGGNDPMAGTLGYGGSGGGSSKKKGFSSNDFLKLIYGSGSK